MSEQDTPELDAALEEFAALNHPLERLIVAVWLVGEPPNAPEVDAQTWSVLGHKLKPEIGRAINYALQDLPESRERVNRVAKRIGMALPDPYDTHDLLERLNAADLVREAEDLLRDEGKGP